MIDKIKKIAGIVWIAAAFAALWFLFTRAGVELSAATVTPEKQIFWYTIIPVYLPLMLGLALFGWYALKGEYSGEVK